MQSAVFIFLGPNSLTDYTGQFTKHFIHFADCPNILNHLPPIEKNIVFLSRKMNQLVACDGLVFAKEGQLFQHFIDPACDARNIAFVERCPVALNKAFMQ